MGTHQVATGKEEADTLIEALDLKVRTYNCLKRSGINTVHQLFSLRKQELLEVLAFRNLTHQSYDEIRERVMASGFMHSTHLIGPFAPGKQVTMKPPRERLLIYGSSVVC